MTQRLSYPKVSPAAHRALLALEQHVRGAGLEENLKDLVYQRVSQLNGCAFCLDMHDKDMRAAGENPERLALLSVFRESPLFNARERAALAYAEALTQLGPHGLPDDVYNAALAEFGEAGLVSLTLAVGMINTWNRVNIAFRTEPGKYQPAKAR